MEDISKYITFLQATKSLTAQRLGIENTPNEDQLKKMKKVGTIIYDKVYEYILSTNKEKISVSSFFRSEELNKKVGGSKTSQHCKGEAIDIDSSYSNSEIFNYIRLNLNFTQLIAEFKQNNEPSWVHVSFSDNNKKQVLISIKENKKTKYLPYSDNLYNKIYVSNT
jgi:hypothetical protein